MTSEDFSNFFLRNKEKEFNKIILEDGFSPVRKEINEYVKKIIVTPVADYLMWLDSNFISAVMKDEEAIQFSNFDDATRNVVHVLIKAGDTGFTEEEIGEMLRTDNKVRKPSTNRKYGENHAKIAMYLGLLFRLNQYYYVSSIGYIYDNLSTEDQKKLYVRMFIRTPLFRTIYLISKHSDIKMRELYSQLKDSTYKRRMSNVRTLFSKSMDADEWDVQKIINKINYEA